MSFPLTLSRALALSFLASLAILPAQADRTITRPVSKGILLRQILQDSPTTPRLITTLEVDVKQPGVRVSAELGQDDVENSGKTEGREAISTLAKRKGLAAAVNGDYFIGGAPVGLCIREGELITLPLINRTVCAMLPGNRIIFDIPRTASTVRIARPGSPPFPITSLNRKRSSDSLVLYTFTYGPKTLTNNFGTEVVLANVPATLKPGRFSGVVKEVRANTGGTTLLKGEMVLSGHGTGATFLKSLQPGDSVEVNLSVQSPKIPDWRVVRDAVGGGPTLVRDGKVFIDAKEQRFQPDIVLGRSPRTAVGVTRAGKLIIAAVDGRQPISVGMTLTEMAELMLRLGCVNAMNLDGGGSTAMAVRGVRVNSPSDGWERSVAMALAVRAPALAASAPAFNLMADMEGPISSGQSIPVELRDEEGEPLDGEPPVVWGVEGPVGFVDQSGRFTAGKSGRGRIVARWGDEVSAFDVEVVPAKTVAKLTASWLPSNPSQPLSSALKVVALDAFGNPIPGVQVIMTLPAGSSADALLRPTDAAGTAIYQIAWAAGSPRHASVSSGSVTFTPPDAPASPSP